MGLRGRGGGVYHSVGVGDVGIPSIHAQTNPAAPDLTDRSVTEYHVPRPPDKSP